MPVNFGWISRQHQLFLERIMFTSYVNDLGEGHITKKVCYWQNQTLADANKSDCVVNSTCMFKYIAPVENNAGLLGNSNRLGKWKF